MNAGLGWPVAAVAGVILWGSAAAAAGKAEPWDSDLYWVVFYPLALVLCVLLGALFPERAWRWALAVMLAQLPIMLVGGSGLGLLPLGIILLLALSLPGMAAAMLGAAAGRRVARP